MSIVGLLKTIEDVRMASMVAGMFLNILENLSMTKSIAQLPKTTQDLWQDFYKVPCDLKS